MRLGSRCRTVRVDGAELQLRRDVHGVVHLRGADDLDFARALGFAHACDRMLQMMMLRVIGRGQICQLLKDDEDNFAIDVYMRRMGFAADARTDVASLSPSGLRFAEAYCSGVNHYLHAHGHPWELRLVGYRPEPWTVADCLLTLQIMSYVGLAQHQEDIERLLIQSLHGGVAPAPLRKLFAPHLEGLTDEIVGLIRQLHLVHTLIPAALRFQAAIPGMSGSNNWVVAPSHSATGHVLQCNDPHLECNRLPAIWYEFVMQTEQGFRMGASMPGIPGLVMGRTEHLSMGFTYGFMDMVDFFIEDCRAGTFRRGDARHPFEVRQEVIHRKRHPDATVTRYENDLGILDTDPLREGVADGLHLLRAWSGRNRSAQALECLWAILSAGTVPRAQAVLRDIPISANWLIGDRQGNIGYQQSGILPDRRHSGLHPLPAWDEENHWRGVVGSERLSARHNPEEGFLVTANGDHNQDGKPLSVNMPMASYREERIAQLLGARDRHTVEDMQAMQTDLFSLQAAAFLDALRDDIPATAVGAVLRDWDLRYDMDSRGATLFEAVYRELLSTVVCEAFGDEIWQQLADATGILALYYRRFDHALLTPGSPWHLGGAGRDAPRILHKVLDRFDPDRIPTWGETQRVKLVNIFFAGRLPRVLGFDHGPVPMEGGRATVAQANVFASHGRRASVGPSWRYVADLGEDAVHTCLAGGPSDRRFSRWYKHGIGAWLARQYKTLAITPPAATS